ncbi:hypothetical protein Droror1_Dr00016604 [Drosera rotundifolia]
MNSIGGCVISNGPTLVFEFMEKGSLSSLLFDSEVWFLMVFVELQPVKDIVSWSSMVASNGRLDWNRISFYESLIFGTQAAGLDQKAKLGYLKPCKQMVDGDDAFVPADEHHMLHDDPKELLEASTNGHLQTVEDKLNDGNLLR